MRLSFTNMNSIIENNHRRKKKCMFKHIIFRCCSHSRYYVNKTHVSVFFLFPSSNATGLQFCRQIKNISEQY
uniref:DN40292_c0_g1_i9 n=1 Tax=Ceratitis capitata TaxID=7213 RepID=A0A6B7K3M3_CERCA|nr:DN40292_c0_g1_i9 [Ceratitis capitata]